MIADFQLVLEPQADLKNLSKSFGVMTPSTV